MRITPADLTPDPLPLDLTVPAGVIEYAPDVRQTGPLHVKGAADRIEEHGGTREVVIDIRVRARCRGMFELLCARCLDPIGHHADLRFDLIFRPSGTDAEAGERSISEAETESGIMKRAAFCWKMLCASRCCFPCLIALSAGKIAKDSARAAAETGTKQTATVPKRRSIHAGVRCRVSVPQPSRRAAPAGLAGQTYEASAFTHAHSLWEVRCAEADCHEFKMF